MSRHFQVSAHEGKGSSGSRGGASERAWQVWLVGAEVRVWLVGAEVHRRWGGECRNSEVIRGRPGEAPQCLLTARNPRPS